MAARDELIQQLTACHRSGTQLKAADWAGALHDEADAYAVQDGVAAALGWRRDRWKSGGAGRQGPFSHSPVGPAISHTLLGVEAEVALRIGRDITADNAHELHADTIDAMCIAVECVASRWEEGLAAPDLLRMADHQSNAGLLLGVWQSLQALNWAQLSWQLAMPGGPGIAGRGGYSLADPTAVLPAWLRHATRNGATLPAGTVVTTGAWGGLHALTDAARAGGAMTLSFDSLGEFTFSVAA